MQEWKLAKLSKTGLPLCVQTLDYPCYQEIHLHDAIELVYVRHASGWCAVNGVIYPMLTGDLYVIPVGLTHEFHADPGLSYVNVLFNEKIFRGDEMELFRHFSCPDAGTPFKYTFGPYLRESMTCRLDELIEEQISVKPWHLLKMRALFIDFLIFVLRNASQSPGVQAACAQKHLGRVLCYINDHLDKKLTLDHLAEISGYAPGYLYRIFRKEMGTGVAEYIRDRRMQQACLALEKSSASIEEIARGNGFFDASYFIKTFKKHCGMTPAAFRRQAGKKEKRRFSSAQPGPEADPAVPDVQTV